MSSPAILLTGATGLLGRFILRRLLEAGHEVATIVRASVPSAAASTATSSQTIADQLARRRIEQVLQPFEANRLLPRPRVIVWDFASHELHPPSTLEEVNADSKQQTSILRLSENDWRWLVSHQLTVIHCAASIRFQFDSHSGEPYRTNVQGTQNLIKLCKNLNLASFHHVSTAYVGDHRSGKPVKEVYVSNPDLGGNDYEKSKIQAELLVTSQLANIPTMIHRPSIVVGDSRTKFTSTFHGFYAPLQIGWQYAKSFGFSEPAGQWFRQRLGLKPEDTKNLVSVDWVAEGISLAVEKGLQPGTLISGLPEVVHWTNPRPVACQEMQTAVVDAIERATTGSTDSQVANTGSAVQNLPSPEQFRDQMEVYESYFQSDPLFHNENSTSIAPVLACPQIDYKLLSKLSDWAIAANFGWPKSLLPELEHQSIVRAFKRFNWLEDRSGCTIIRVQLLGPSSPETLFFAIAADRCGRVAECTHWDQLWRLPLASITSCITGTTALSETIRQGYWLIEGKTGHNALDCAQIWINHIRKFLE